MCPNPDILIIPCQFQGADCQDLSYKSKQIVFNVSRGFNQVTELAEILLGRG